MIALGPADVSGLCPPAPSVYATWPHARELDWRANKRAEGAGARLPGELEEGVDVVLGTLVSS